MHFDFYERYKDYPDTELQHITQQPDAYQPAAVDAASRILKERGVKEEIVKPATIPEEPGTHLLDSFDLMEETKPPKLLIFFLLLVTLEYLRSVYSTVKLSFIEGMLESLYFVSVSLITLTFIPFVFYLLLKRKAWGWILLFIGTAMDVVSRIMQTDILFTYIGLDTVQGLVFIATTFLKLGLIIYMWQKPILVFFHVSKEAKFWTSVAFICILTAIAIFRFTFAYRGF